MTNLHVHDKRKSSKTNRPIYPNLNLPITSKRRTDASVKSYGESMDGGEREKNNGCRAGVATIVQL